MTSILLPWIALLAVAGEEARVGDFHESVKVCVQAKATERSYWVHIPRSYDSQKPMPVVLLLHGLGMNGRMMMMGFGVREKSEREGFLLVCPDATAYANLVPYWNCGGLQLDKKVMPNDIAFMTQLLDKLESQYCVDTKRIYVIGLSNGAMMAHRMALEMPDRIAAIATLSGTLAKDCKLPEHPMPVLHFHGTDDHWVPYTGSHDEDDSQLAHFKSVDETIGIWAKADGCPPNPAVETLPDVARDGMKVTKTTYGPGKEGSEVVLYVVDGGGHTWPGLPPPVSFIGRSSKNISATNLIWEFFEKHSKK